MFSIFFGFSGAGGGGSSFFLGITYGPTSFCGPPASGGASCLFGFDGGCCEVSWARAGVERVTVTPQNSANASQIRRLQEATERRFRPPKTPQIMGKPRKTPVLV